MAEWDTDSRNLQRLAVRVRVLVMPVRVSYALSMQWPLDGPDLSHLFVSYIDTVAEKALPLISI